MRERTVTTESAEQKSHSERCAQCGHTRESHSGRQKFLWDQTPGILLKGYDSTLNRCIARGGFTTMKRDATAIISA